MRESMPPIPKEPKVDTGKLPFTKEDKERHQREFKEEVEKYEAIIQAYEVEAKKLGSSLGELMAQIEKLGGVEVFKGKMMEYSSTYIIDPIEGIRPVENEAGIERDKRMSLIGGGNKKDKRKCDKRHFFLFYDLYHVYCSA